MKIDPQIHLFISSPQSVQATCMVKVDKKKFSYSQLDIGNSKRTEKFKSEMLNHFKGAGLITHYAANLSVITLELNPNQAKKLLSLPHLEGIKFYL